MNNNLKNTSFPWGTRVGKDGQSGDWAEKAQGGSSAKYLNT